MDVTDAQGLPFPLGQDMGAGARQLQDLAELLETKMNRIDAGWLLRRNPPSWIVRRTTTQALSPGAFRDVVWESVDSDNTGNRAPLLSGSTIYGKLATETHGETWWVGAYVMFAGGTPANSLRTIQLRAESFDVASGAVLTQDVTLSGYESSSGGEQMVAEGMVRVAANSTLRLRAYHTASAALNFNGGSFMWATRVSQEA